MTAPTYLILDTETTGFYPQKHGLIQLAAVVCDKNLNVLQEFNADVCPPSDVEISEQALEVNGFTLDRINKGISYTQLTEDFYKFLNIHFEKDYKPIVIGQFYPFDFAHLQAIFVQEGYEVKLCQDLLQNDFIDTKALVNFANLLTYQAEQGVDYIPFPSTSLSKPGGLKDILEIDSSKFVAHDAMGDVMATLEVLKALIPKFRFSLFPEDLESPVSSETL